MFYAALFACHAAFHQCAVMVDTWGPHQTKVECAARVKVMEDALMKQAGFVPLDNFCGTEAQLEIQKLIWQDEGPSEDS